MALVHLQSLKSLNTAEKQARRKTVAAMQLQLDFSVAELFQHVES